MKYIEGCSQTHRKQERAETRNEEEEEREKKRERERKRVADERGALKRRIPNNYQKRYCGTIRTTKTRPTGSILYRTDRLTTYIHTMYHNNRTSLMALMNTTSPSLTTPARAAWVIIVLFWLLDLLARVVCTVLMRVIIMAFMV
jgi:hypothetical protein